MNEAISFGMGMAINEWNLQPNSVMGSANSNTWYHKRQLWQLLNSVYKFTLPEGWKENWFRYWLFHYGSVGVFYTYEYGWVPLPYSIEEMDLQFNPRRIFTYNGYLKTPVRGIVGVNCQIIKVADDYFGLNDVVDHFAERLANLDKAEQINIMNCNVGLMAEVSDKKEGDEVKAAYSDATTGKPLVVLNKNILKGQQLKTMISNPAGIYLIDKYQYARNQIIKDFLTVVGIPNANYDKKERLNSAEVGENHEEVYSRRGYIFDHIKEDMDATNKIASIGLNVEFRYPERSLDDYIGGVLPIRSNAAGGDTAAGGDD